MVPGFWGAHGLYGIFLRRARAPVRSDAMHLHAKPVRQVVNRLTMTQIGLLLALKGSKEPSSLS